VNIINIIKEEYKNILKEETDYRGEHEAPSRDYGSPLHDVTEMFGNDFYDLSVNEIARQFGGGTNYDYKTASIIKSYHNKPNAKIKIFRAVPDLNKENKDKQKDLLFIVRFYDKFNFYPTTGKYKKYAEIVHEYENIIKNENNDIDYDSLQNEIYKRIYVDIQKLESTKTKLTINHGDWVSIIREYAVDHGKNNLNNNYVILTKTVKAKDIYTEGYMEEWGYDPSGNINEDYRQTPEETEEDIQSFYDMIDLNPDSLRAKEYINTLKVKYNHEYVPYNIRFGKDMEIVNKLINKKHKVTTNKGFDFYFTTKHKNNLPRTVAIDIFNMNGDQIGGVGFNIDTNKKEIKIGGALVYEKYRRKGIYSSIVDYIEDIGDKFGLEIVEAGRSTDAKEFWRDRLNKSL